MASIRPLFCQELFERISACSFASLQLLERLDRTTVGQHVDEREILVAVVRNLVFEGQDDRAEQTVLQPVQLLRGHAERFGHLARHRDPAELGRQSLLHTLELASEGSHRSRRPVGGPHGVEDRSPNSLSGEPIERYATGLVVTTSRLYQTQGSRPGQLVPIHVPGEVHRHLEHDVFDQWQMLFDELRRALRFALGYSHPASPPSPALASCRPRAGGTLGERGCIPGNYIPVI